MRSQYAHMVYPVPHPYNKIDFSKVCADLSEVRNYSGGVRTRQFPPVAMLLKVISITVTNAQNVLHKF